MPDVSTAGDYLKGLARAFGPDLVGMPVDAAQEALNLLIAGGGFVGHKLGLLKQPPDLLHGSPGTSDWWADKVNIPDNGSAAYTAGRLTPLGVALTKAASPAAAEALKKGMANLQAPVAASPRAGQRGAIRVGGDPELFASHATTAENLKAALGKGRSLELYSPSIGITRGMDPANFGNLILVPKVGAFDPATSTSTLFNRDAWTSRYNDYQGKSLGSIVENSDLVQKLRDMGVKLPEPAAMSVRARQRLEDLFHDARPEDTKLNEGLGFGEQGDGPGGLHQVAIKLSPAFRSLKQYEESPVGAKLLNGQSERSFQRKALDKAFGNDTWVGHDAMSALVGLAGLGPENFKTALPGSRAVRQAWANNGFAGQFAADMQDPQTVGDLWKKASLARRLIRHTPSKYAELKVHGPAPVNAENWAFGFVRPGSSEYFPDEVRGALYRAGVPVLSPNDIAPRTSGELDQIVREMQAAMGPARKSPL